MQGRWNVNAVVVCFWDDVWMMRCGDRRPRLSCRNIITFTIAASSESITLISIKILCKRNVNRLMSFRWIAYRKVFCLWYLLHSKFNPQLPCTTYNLTSHKATQYLHILPRALSRESPNTSKTLLY
jgi:hypothetical protein